MEKNIQAHWDTLAAEALASLRLYEHFKSQYEVRFSLAAPDEKGLPRLAARFLRVDGVPFRESELAREKKYAALPEGQTVILRPFYLPMCKAEWDESEANQFTQPDFDYALVLGYGRKDGEEFLKSLYMMPADALLCNAAPDGDGVYRKLHLASFFMYQMSLDPRVKFSRHLYLGERFCEALEYQYDKYGRYFSRP